MIIESRAYARAGLLGNPSDGYFGKTISVSVRNFGAHISLYHSPELKIEHQPQDIHGFRSIYDLVDSINMHGYYGADRLIKAAIKKLYEYCQEHEIRLENKNFTIRYHSTIPRQVGLAGSSAIITATMRALLKFYDLKIPREILPTLILATEKEELGMHFEGRIENRRDSETDMLDFGCTLQKELDQEYRSVVEVGLDIIRKSLPEAFSISKEPSKNWLFEQLDLSGFTLTDGVFHTSFPLEHYLAPFLFPEKGMTIKSTKAGKMPRMKFLILSDIIHHSNTDRKSSHACIRIRRMR